MTYCYETIKDTAKAKSEVRKKIMAVDDEHDITITLKVGLEVDGPFDVDIFNDSKSALHSFYYMNTVRLYKYISVDYFLCLFEYNKMKVYISES
jgi:hypothetical protein